MAKITSRKERQRSKHLRVRKIVSGTSERPRLCVSRSLNHIYAQIIDDSIGKTLVAASTNDKALRSDLKVKSNKAAAKVVGEMVAERALAKGITQVVFDRGGFLYHGRIKSLADAAREKGLKF